MIQYVEEKVTRESSSLSLRRILSNRIMSPSSVTGEGYSMKVIDASYDVYEVLQIGLHWTGALKTASTVTSFCVYVSWIWDPSAVSTAQREVFQRSER